MPTWTFGGGLASVVDEGTGTGNTFHFDLTSATTATDMLIWQVWMSSTATSTIAQVVDPRRQGAALFNSGNVAAQLEGARTQFEEKQRLAREKDEAERAADPLGLKRSLYERTLDAARAKAIGILCDHLDSAQIASLVRANNYIVQGQSGKLYRIDLGYARNVRRIVDGKPVESYCAHPRNAYEMPDCDSMLMQTLMIQHSEDAFLKIANRHPADAREERVAA